MVWTLLSPTEPDIELKRPVILGPIKTLQPRGQSLKKA